MLRERPDDQDGLREEIELESAARRYQQFYIRLVDDPRHADHDYSRNGRASLMLRSSPERLGTAPNDLSRCVGGSGSRHFGSRAQAASVDSPATHTDTIQIAIDISQEEALLARYRFWFWLDPLLVSSILFPAGGVRRSRVRAFDPWEYIAATASENYINESARAVSGAEGYPLELASLAGTFNEMLDRLGRIVRADIEILGGYRSPDPADTRQQHQGRG